MNRSLRTIPFILLVLLSLPSTIVDPIRAKALFAIKPFRANTAPSNHEETHLELENHQLRKQLDLVYEWLESEKRLQEQVDLFRGLQNDPSLPKETLSRRTQQLKSLLQAQTLSIFAQIVHRDPGSWSSSCWIDVGEDNNEAFGKTILAKNSPVVIGNSLIGIVEYVGKRQSRVKLITDSGLKVAVRAVRGSLQEREAFFFSRQLSKLLQKQPAYKNHPITQHLELFQSQLSKNWQDIYLAKGEVNGSSEPYFRSLSPRLSGVGFNCDFPDAEGKAKDLRSIEPSGPILQAGDLLITSGLDGAFPPGLRVGIVEEIKPLKPGDFSYELVAIPTAGRFDDLKTVFILPPIH